MTRVPHILLVNPWITDFAAYDLWAKPLGLLLLGALLREGGCGVSFLDCLDRNDPGSRDRDGLLPPTFQRHGTGKYAKTPIRTPDELADIPRRYFRYGIPPDELRKKLRDRPAPDMVWMTCAMTYWYPGAQQTLAVIRECLPETPVWLGGVYARLCNAHARAHSGVDHVCTANLAEMPDLLESRLGWQVNNPGSWNGLPHCPRPAMDLVPDPDYIPILTSLGCPFVCPYCAAPALQPGWSRRPAESILEEVLHWNEERGVVDFAFYDDALLVDAGTTLRPALERLCRRNLNLRFHTPNAIHIRNLDREWCNLLHAAGFETIRLGLETTRPAHQAAWGGKADMDEFHRAIDRLSEAGFTTRQIGVYLLCGLPGQKPHEVADSIRMVRSAGALPYLSEYSPIPGTAFFEKAREASEFDICGEPLTHNNSFFACRRPDFTYDDLVSLKQLARVERRTLDVV